MEQEEFDKLYFKAKLAGSEAIAAFLLQLMKAQEQRFVLKLIQSYAVETDNFLMTEDSVSGDRHCERSPYALCFCTPFTVDEQKPKPTDMYCIWCAKIYTPEITSLTKPNIEWTHHGAYIIDGINF